MAVGDLHGLVVEAQQVSDEILTDTCVITRVGEPSFDPVNGETAGKVTTIIGSAACRVRMPSRLEKNTLAGDHEWTLKDAILRLSAALSGLATIRKGDMVSVSTVQGVGLSKQYEIIASVEGSHMSSARFIIRRGEG